MFVLGDTEAVCRAEWAAANYLQAMPDLSTAEEQAERNPVLFRQSARNAAEIEAVRSDHFLLGTSCLRVLFSLATGSCAVPNQIC